MVFYHNLYLLFLQMFCSIYNVINQICLDFRHAHEFFENICLSFSYHTWFHLKIQQPDRFLIRYEGKNITSIIASTEAKYLVHQSMDSSSSSISSTTSCFGDDFFPNDDSFTAGWLPLALSKFSFISRSACAFGIAYVPYTIWKFK